MGIWVFIVVCNNTTFYLLFLGSEFCMNENIRKFLTQAEDEVLEELKLSDKKSPLSLKERINERLAQLLIKHCAAIADGQYGLYPYTTHGEMMRNYFGVKND